MPRISMFEGGSLKFSNDALKGRQQDWVSNNSAR